MNNLIAKGNKPSDFRWKDRESVTNKSFNSQSVKAMEIYIVEVERLDGALFRYGHFLENDARYRASGILDMASDNIKDVVITKCNVYVYSELAEGKDSNPMDKYTGLIEGDYQAYYQGCCKEDNNENS